MLVFIPKGKGKELRKAECSKHINKHDLGRTHTTFTHWPVRC